MCFSEFKLLSQASSVWAQEKQLQFCIEVIKMRCEERQLLSGAC